MLARGCQCGRVGKVKDSGRNGWWDKNGQVEGNEAFVTLARLASLWRDNRLMACDLTMPEYEMVVSFIAGMSEYEESSKTSHGSKSQASMVFDGDIPGLDEAMEAGAISLDCMFD